MSDTEEAAAEARCPLERLEAEICQLAGQLTAGTARWLQLVAEFDRREGWAQWGVRSCAHWLSWKCGLAPGAAREHVRVARALQGLPLVAAAFGDGRLSYSKVRALTRVATPQLEAELVDIALAGTASHVERITRGYRRVQRCESTGQDRRYADRYLRWYWDDEGALVLRGRLPPEEGALVLAALAAAHESQPETDEPAGNVPTGTPMPAEPVQDVPAEPVPAGSVPAGTPQPAGNVPAESPPLPSVAALTETTFSPSDPEVDASLERPEPPGDTVDQADVPAGTPPARSAADALVTMAETLLAAGPAHLLGADRYQVVVHVGLDTLRVPPVAPQPPGSRAETEDGVPLLPETLSRLACDSSLLAVLDDAAGSPLDVGRKTRSVPAALRRALRCRDGGCRFPGCAERRHVDAHHIQHWARGGPTSAANLVLLCEFHHRRVHEGGFEIDVLGPGRFRFRRPDGVPVPAAPPSEPVTTDLEEVLADLEITAETIVSSWGGERLDLDAALFALLNRPQPAAAGGSIGPDR